MFNENALFWLSLALRLSLHAISEGVRLANQPLYRHNFPPVRVCMRSIKRHFSHFLKDATLTLILLAVAMPSLAQSGDQGSISGVVFDSSGAVVADARVKIRNVSTSFAVSTTTIDSGLFFFPILPVGLYELTADHAGFATIQLNNIDLTVGANLTLTLRFSVAGGKEAIAVMDETPILEKSRSQLSTTIDNRFISNLPVNGRDFTAFALLTPGVTMDVRGGLSFAGQRAMNSLLLDGLNYDDPQEALEIIRQLQHMSKQSYVAPNITALIYSRLGEKSAAIAWLEKATPEDDPKISDPGFANLRSEPRFKILEVRLTPSQSCPAF